MGLGRVAGVLLRNVLVMRCSKLDAHATREVRAVPLSRFHSYKAYSQYDHVCTVPYGRCPHLSYKRCKRRVRVGQTLPVYTVMLDEALTYPRRNEERGDSIGWSIYTVKSAEDAHTGHPDD